MGLFDQIQDPKFNMFAQKPVKKTEKDPMDSIRQETAFENGIKMLLGKEFGGRANGFEVFWEAKHYRPSLFGKSKFLEGVKEQAGGRAPKIAEIFFRGKYLCDVSEAMTPPQVIDVINQALFARIKRNK